MIANMIAESDKGRHYALAVPFSSFHALGEKSGRPMLVYHDGERIQRAVIVAPEPSVLIGEWQASQRLSATVPQPLRQQIGEAQ